MRGVKRLICPTRPAEYFSREDWTTQITLNLFSKLHFWCTAFSEQLQRLEPHRRLILSVGLFCRGRA
jgi:hypothetical protein